MYKLLPPHPQISQACAAETERDMITMKTNFFTKNKLCNRKNKFASKGQQHSIANALHCEFDLSKGYYMLQGGWKTAVDDAEYGLTR